MNLAFFPACALPGEFLRQILDGGMSIIREAGACLVGGHTVEDDQLKYGLSVTGLIDPQRVIRNSSARPGDRLLLTKPLGTGIISTAIKGELATDSQVSEAVAWMGTLNREAAGLMAACRASAATDVTGFGLIGHAVEMALGAGVTLRLQLKAIPLMSGVADLMAEGMLPAGCYRNRDHYGRQVSTTAAPDALLPLFDPQTSGGLLISLAPPDADRFLAEADRCGIYARQIGEVLPESGIPLEIS